MAEYVGIVNDLTRQPVLPVGLDNRVPLIPRPMTAAKLPVGRDVVQLGVSGKPDAAESLRMVNERALDKLRKIVAQAREELGLPEDAQVDLSPEATGDRIADFALKWFGQWAKNNKAQDTEEDRARFVDFIGGAVRKGVEEARGILKALNALNPEIEGMIDKTMARVQARFDDFVRNGLTVENGQA
jgi:hypothetical protein